jgi:hypothetical protein
MRVNLKDQAIEPHYMQESYSDESTANYIVHGL